jgi:hypothetical protein
MFLLLPLLLILKYIVMKNFISYFNLNNWTLTAFYPYTSIVSCRILEQNFNYKTEEHDFLHAVGNKVKSLALQHGLDWDNKVVVQLTEKSHIAGMNQIPAVIYVGFKDGLVSIGLGMYQDAWLTDKNKYFKP